MYFRKHSKRLIQVFDRFGLRMSYNEPEIIECFYATEIVNNCIEKKVSLSPTITSISIIHVAIDEWVFIFFHHEGFFRLQDVQYILERYGWMILFCEYIYACFYLVPLSPYLKVSYFASKDENSSHRKLERKRYDILMTSKKTIYTDMGYKSTPH